MSCSRGVTGVKEIEKTPLFCSGFYGIISLMYDTQSSVRILGKGYINERTTNEFV